MPCPNGLIVEAGRAPEAVLELGSWPAVTVTTLLKTMLLTKVCVVLANAETVVVALASAFIVAVVVPGVGRPRQSQALESPELMESIATAVESKDELCSSWRMKFWIAAWLTALLLRSGAPVGAGGSSEAELDGVTVLVLVTVTLTTLLMVATRVDVTSVTVLYGRLVIRESWSQQDDIRNSCHNGIDRLNGAAEQSGTQLGSGLMGGEDLIVVVGGHADIILALSKDVEIVQEALLLALGVGASSVCNSGISHM